MLRKALAVLGLATAKMVSVASDRPVRFPLEGPSISIKASLSRVRRSHCARPRLTAAGRYALSPVAVGIAFLLCAPAQAALLTVERVQFKGDVAFLRYEEFRDVSCPDGSPGQLYLSGDLIVLNNVTRGDGSRVATQRLELLATRIDSCTGVQQTLRGILDDPSGYKQSSTVSARIVATLELVDVSTGEPAGTASVDVRFARIKGTTARSHGFESTATPTEITRFQSHGTFVEATVTGFLVINGVDVLRSVTGAQLGADTVALRVVTGLPSRAVTGTPSVAVPFKVTRGRFTSKVDFAGMKFEAVEPTTCADGSAGEVMYRVLVSAVAAISGSLESGTDTQRNLQVEIHRLDSCSTVGLPGLSGTLDDPPLLELNGAQLARVAGTVDLTDMETGAPAGSTTVDLTFTAIPNTVHDVTMFHNSSPTERLWLRQVGDFNSASVAGSVVFDGIDLFALRTDTPYAELGSNIDSIRVVTRIVPQ